MSCAICRQTYICESGDLCSEHSHYEKTIMEHYGLRNTQEWKANEKRLDDERRALNEMLRRNAHFPSPLPRRSSACSSVPRDWDSAEQREEERCRVEELRVTHSRERAVYRKKLRVLYEESVKLQNEEGCLEADMVNISRCKELNRNARNALRKEIEKEEQVGKSEQTAEWRKKLKELREEMIHLEKECGNIEQELGQKMKLTGLNKQAHVNVRELVKKTDLEILKMSRKMKEIDDALAFEQEEWNAKVNK